MKHQKLFVPIIFLLAFSSAVCAQTQNISISQPLQSLPDIPEINNHINNVTAKIDDAAGAESIMENLLADSGGQRLLALPEKEKKKTFKDKDFYCVIHVLRWSAPAAANNSQTVQAQNWYLYNNQELTLGNPTTIPRLFGAKTITLLYIHLNQQAAPADQVPLYEIEVKKRTPAYISHLLGVAELFRGLSSADPGFAAFNLLAIRPNDYWAAHTFTLKYKVSDITMTPKVTRPVTGAVEEAGLAQKFDNEGKYLVDFSVGVPIRKISQLKFDSTNNTVSANEVDKTDILALVNIYPRPIDIRSTKVDWMPHFVGGVAIAKQPLHKIFVGTGFGPIVANAYIGALFTKQEQLTTLNPGDPATPAQLSNDLRRRYKTQFAFGLNVPIGAIVEKLKK